MSSKKVLIASMPWAQYYMASIQVATLKAFLQLNGVHAQGAHWFVNIAHILGFDTYSAIWSSDIEDGEVLYSYLLFPEMQSKILEDPSLMAKQEVSNVEDADQSNGKIKFRLSEDFFREFDQAHQRILDQYDWDDYVLVGFTLNFAQTTASLYMANEIKKRNPDCKIIIGGAEATGSLGGSLIKHFEQLDFACNGEGEKPLLNLSQAILRNASKEAIANTPGIISRGLDGEIRINPPDQLKSLGELQIPNMDDYFETLDQFEDVSRRRAQRHAHADFMRARLHQKRHDAIDPDQRQHEGATRKHNKQRGVETRLPDRFGNHLFHRRDLADWLIAIKLRHHASDRGG